MIGSMADMLGLPEPGRYTPSMNPTPSSSPLRAISILIWSLALVFQAGCSSQSSSSDEGRILELRAGSIEELSDWDRTDLVIGGSQVWMSPDVAVDDDMIESVEKTLDHEGRTSLLIGLDAAGTAELAKLSVEQLSRPIVVVIDGRPSSAPIVMSPLGPLFIITAADLTDEDWDDLARRLRHENE